MKNGWQSIETAPKDGTKVMVYVKDFDLVTEAWFSLLTGLWPHSEEFTEDGDPCNVGMPSHWMPLPNPAETEK